MKRLHPNLVLFGQLYHSGSFFCSKVIPGIIKLGTGLPKLQTRKKIIKKVKNGLSVYANFSFGHLSSR